MVKPATLPRSHLFSLNIWTYFLQKGVTKVKPDINSVNVHPQLSHNRHPVDGVLVGVGSLRPTCIWPTCVWNTWSDGLWASSGFLFLSGCFVLDLKFGKLNFLCFWKREHFVLSSFFFFFGFFWGGGILGVKLVPKLNISLLLEDELFFFLHFFFVIFWVMGDTKEGSFFFFFFLLGYGDLKLVN